MKSPSPRAWTIPRPGLRRGPLLGILLGISFGLGLVTACGVPGEARRGARVLAAYTNQVKAETERFAKARTALARARQRNVDELEQSAVATEQANQREIFLWAFEKPAPGPSRQELYQGIVAASDATRKQLDDLAALRKQHEARVAQATTRVNARTIELAEAAKALAQLGEKPSFKQRMKFYLCFFESVHRSIEDAQQAGAAQAQLGTAAAEAKQTGDAAPGGDAGAAPPATPPAPATGAPPDSAASKSACQPAS
jgi:hypothetical protein